MNKLFLIQNIEWELFKFRMKFPTEILQFCYRRFKIIKKIETNCKNIISKKKCIAVLLCIAVLSICKRSKFLSNFLRRKQKTIENEAIHA